MYLVLCKAERTMIPCAEVMWLTNDLYKCVILREDIDQNKYTHFVAHGKDIFTIVDSILLNTLIRSQKESQESVETFDFVTLNMENSPQIWAVYKGGYSRHITDATKDILFSLTSPKAFYHIWTLHL